MRLKKIFYMCGIDYQHELSKIITPNDPEFWLEVANLDYFTLEVLYVGFIHNQEISNALKTEKYLRDKNPNFRSVLN